MPRITVSWKPIGTISALDTSKPEAIKKKYKGRYAGGSGYSFVTNERDIDYSFNEVNLRKAKTAFKRAGFKVTEND